MLVVGLVVLARAAYLVSDVYAAVTDNERIGLLDEPTLRLVMEARSPWLDTAPTVSTNVAGVVALPILGLLVIVVLAARRREWVPVALGLWTGAGSSLLTQAGKELFGRDRATMSEAVPPYETSVSIPSKPRAERHGRRRQRRVPAGATPGPTGDASADDHGDRGVHP